MLLSGTLCCSQTYPASLGPAGVQKSWWSSHVKRVHAHSGCIQTMGQGL